LWATIRKNTTGSPPVSSASIQVQLLWRAALPGSEQGEPPMNLPEIRLRESKQTPGRYEGSLVATMTEGYYRLASTVKPVSERAVRLEELIAIEALPAVPTS